MEQHNATTATGPFQELSSKEVQEDFQVCDHKSCLNSYTPWLDADGGRYCLTHGKR